MLVNRIADPAPGDGPQGSAKHCAGRGVAVGQGRSRLKSHSDCAVIPTLVLSSSYQQADIVKAYELSANAFLAKPNDVKVLAEQQWKEKPLWRSRKVRHGSAHLNEFQRGRTCR